MPLPSDAGKPNPSAQSWVYDSFGNMVATFRGHDTYDTVLTSRGMDAGCTHESVREWYERSIKA